jgi:predicted transcriptional regulator
LPSRRARFNCFWLSQEYFAEDSDRAKDLVARLLNGALDPVPNASTVVIARKLRQAYLGSTSAKVDFKKVWRGCT